MSNGIALLSQKYTVFCLGVAVWLPGCKDNAELRPRTPPAWVVAPDRPAKRAPALPAGYEASIVPARGARESAIAISESTHTLIGENLRMAEIISVAYGTPERTGEDAAEAVFERARLDDNGHTQLAGHRQIVRSVIPRLSAVRVLPETPLPAGRFDVAVYVPGGTAEELRQALRGTLEKSFHFRVHRRARDTDALVLVALSSGIKRFDPSRVIAQESGTTRMTLSGTDLNMLAEQLEDRLGRPVVNEAVVQGAYKLWVDCPTDGRAASVAAGGAVVEVADRARGESQDAAADEEAHDDSASRDGTLATHAPAEGRASDGEPAVESDAGKGESAPPVALAAAQSPTPSLDRVRSALQDQLGLDLMPWRRQVEFLIVQRAADAPRSSETVATGRRP